MKERGLFRRAVFCRVGVERAVVERGFYGQPLAHERLGLAAEERVGEAFPDIVDSLLRRVQHVKKKEKLLPTQQSLFFFQRRFASDSRPSGRKI